MSYFILFAIALMLTLSQHVVSADLPGYAPGSANPILPGYYADPSIVQEGEATYIYATLDPWGGETLGCWESRDWKNWTFRELNWPTKKACTTPISSGAMVWAPSVIRGRDGKFHMAVSVGSEVWMGVADHPLGPWKNARADNKPLIPENFKPGYHMIDAELFLDDDGQAYLYWGSGHNWKNGKCWVVKLKPDMASFEGEEKEITPPHYFEAPFMVKRDGLYYLMYSDGVTIKDTYCVHYAVGKSPLGPFVEGPSSCVLSTDATKGVISPGHHAVFEKDGEMYILYHRHSIPFDPKFIGRQMCVDRMTIANGKIESVKATHEGPALVQNRHRGLTSGKMTASSQLDEYTGPERLPDANYATRWAADKKAKGAWVQCEFPTPTKIARQEIRTEYAWKTYQFSVLASEDGKTWETLADFTSKGVKGSPIVIERAVSARYVRIVFPESVPGQFISLFEWSFFDDAAK